MKNHSLFPGPFALSRVAVAAAFSALAVLPTASWSLGLGRLSVQSALGEALKAEIDVTSLSPEESATLQVMVASPDTYRAAGVDFNQVLTATSIQLRRRSDGHPYLRITSDKTVQEPFVDVILELAWSTGRLVREYTLLFDPPASRSAAPVAAPVIEAAPAPAPVPVVAQPQSHAQPNKSAFVAPTEQAVKSKKPAPVPPSAASAAETPPPVPTKSTNLAAAPQEAQPDAIRVKHGDSLSGIASRNLPDGVSLDQMLVGLYRQNPDAFQGNNMNRLKAGVVLNVPDAEKAKAVAPQEARQLIQAQSADFAAYRQQLASTVTASKADAPENQAKGKVDAEVTDRKLTDAPTPDKLTLSKGSVAGASSAPATEDRVAKARAKEDNSARVAELSKNLDELHKLKEKATVASAPTKADVPAPAPMKASAPTELEPQSVASAASSGAQTMDIAQVASSATSNVATGVADASSAVASAPKEDSRPSLPAPAPVAEPESGSFLESLNPMLLAVGGTGLALLAGAAMFLRSRRKSDSGETSFLESRLQPDSFFGASGGQRVDTRDASGAPSSMSYSLSQLDAIGDVDPVAEADVYLAYGRDLQAEEILKEALRSSPERLAVRTKLLEVYAKRRDTKGFEQLAVQLYQLTQGVGDDWAKAQELGLGIDPENPLYQVGGRPSSVSPMSFESGSDGLGASTVPHLVMPSPSMLDTIAPPASELAEHHSDAVDLDLDISAPAPLGAVMDSVSPAPAPRAPEVTFSESSLPPLDPVGATPAPAGFDLSGISLDLDQPVAESAPADDWLDAAPEQPAVVDPMSRKFDLAEEFRQIGDVDGARELLQEVLDNAKDGALKSKAQRMLDSLG